MLVVGMPACGGDEPTSLRIDVFVDVADELALRGSRIRMQLFDSGGQAVHEQEETLMTPGRDERLPFPIQVEPRLAASDRSFRLLAELTSANRRFLGLQQVRSNFESGGGEIRVEFDTLCEGARCLPDEVCVGGECRPACFVPEPLGTAERSTPAACPPVMPAPVYVDGVDGTDVPLGSAPDCTDRASPCRSINYVLDVGGGGYGQAGLVVNVRGSEGGDRRYDPLRLEMPIGGMPGAPLVLRAWPGTGIPILEGNESVPPVHFCCSDDASAYVVIDGFRIRGGPVGILMNGGSAVGNTIRNCIIEDNVGNGMAEFGEQSGGITLLNDTQDIVIERNIIRNNIAGMDAGSVPGIRLGRGNVQTKIVNNVISGNANNGILGGGIDSEIRDNLIFSNGQPGLRLRTGTRAQVLNNWICNNGSAGVAFDTSGVRLENNTIVGHSDAAIQVLITTQGVQTSIGMGEARNNVLASSGVGIRIDAGATIDDSHNLFFDNMMGDFVGGVSSTPDTNVSGDPGYEVSTDTNPCARRRLDPASIAVGAGVDGTDIGAD